MDAKDYIQRLNELSVKKLALIEEIRVFTLSQNKTIKEGKYEELDTLLEERQNRMDAVDKLDEQFLIFSSKLKSILSLDSLEDLPRHHLSGTSTLKDIVARINERIAEIKRMEDENSALVRNELKETKAKIDHANAFKRVSGAYYPPKTETRSYYFDKKK
jgi:hypothetical protein